MKQKSQNLWITLGLILSLSLGLALFFVTPKIEAKSEPSDITIANFEKGSQDWQGTGAFATDHTKEGKNSLKLTSKDFNWDAQSSTNVDLDLSTFAKGSLEMAIFVYIDDPTQISGIRLDLGDDNSNFFYAYQRDANFLQKGWNEIRFKADDFAPQYAPTGWAQIKWLRVNLAATDNLATVSAWFDDWKLTSAPATIIPAVLGATTNVNTATPGASQTNAIMGPKTSIWGIAVVADLILIGLVVWLILKRRVKNKTL